MPRFNNIQDLTDWRDQALQTMQVGKNSGITIYVGMGTCGLAAGAGDTMEAILRELSERGVNAQLKSVGCIGMCVKEPLVDIQLAGQPRITYVNVNPGMVPRMIEDHVINGNVVEEWAIGYVPPEW